VNDIYLIYDIVLYAFPFHEKVAFKHLDNVDKQCQTVLFVLKYMLRHDEHDVQDTGINNTMSWLYHRHR